MGWRAAKVCTAVACGLALGLPSAAQALENIGQTGAALECTGQESYVQTTSVSGSSYSPSAYGVITSWSAFANSTPNETEKLLVLQPVGGSQLTAVAKDEVRTFTSVNTLNRFTGVRLPIEPGQRLGLYAPGPFGTGAAPCESSSVFSSDTTSYTPGGPGEPPLSSPFDYSGTDSQTRLNVRAVVESDFDRDVFGDSSQDNCLGTPGQYNGCPSTLTLNSVSQSGKNAVAVTATVPGRGKVSAGAATDPTVLAAAAKKKKKKPTIPLRPASQTATLVTGQTVRLTLALTKSAENQLKTKGKLNLPVKATYAPTGGPSATQLSQVKLKLKKKKR
jgi:hypothetical protein